MCCVSTSVSYVDTLPVAQFVKCQILKISRNRTGGFRSSGMLGVVFWQWGTDVSVQHMYHIQCPSSHILL